MNAWIHECMSSVDWLHSQTLRLQRFSVASVAIIVQIFPLIFGIDPQPPGGRPIGSNSPLVKRNKFRFDLKRERERERERERGRWSGGVTGGRITGRGARVDGSWGGGARAAGQLSPLGRAQQISSADGNRLAESWRTRKPNHSPPSQSITN